MAIGVSFAPLRDIAQSLNNQRLRGLEIHTLHLVAHGRPGGFHLGGHWIEAGTLIAASQELAHWGVKTIALWSCETGMDPAFVALLEELTGASVWASPHRLGKGQWQLASNGSTASASPVAPFDSQTLNSWAHELADFSFVGAYQVTNTADKETNLHTFNTSAFLPDVKITDGNPLGLRFSGNDVCVQVTVGTGPSAQIYYGWISRPIKVNGIVRGFYFWTDAQFTNLSLAQADGNADADGNPLDNTGFVFVVDPANFTTGSIGSSSDRVDSALNQLATSNVSPVANNDLADGTAGTVAAVEAGLGVTSVNGSGNVLTNDTDANNDTLKVIKIGTSSASLTDVVSGTTSGTGTSVVGLYGTITIGSDGTYSYQVDNSNPTVDALQVGGSLTDTFSYSISDGKGGTATATVSIRINGSNDAPIANPDYNIAEESVTGVSGSGYSAVGNVLTNDTDVDSPDTKEIVGLVGGATIATSTNNSPSTTLRFLGDNGFSAVNAGRSLYVNISGIYRLVYDSAGNPVTVLSKTEVSTNNWDIVLSAPPASYYQSGTSPSITTTAITDISSFFTANSSVGFESSTDTTENTAGMKTATVSSSTTAASATINLTGASLSGTIAAGMTVSGTGVPAGTTITSVTYDSNGVPISVVVNNTITSTNGTTLQFTAAGGSTITGRHGTLQLLQNGSYTYTPFADNPLLNSGQSAVEVFDYSMKDSQGAIDNSQLTITVFGTGTNDPNPTSDTGTAFEAGVGRNPADNTLTNDNTLYSGANATGNVLSNDTNVSGGGTLSVVNYRKVDGTGNATAGNTLVGTYGSLTVSAAGLYTYTPDNNNPAVQALLPGETLTESFYYTVSNTLSGSAVGQLTVTVNGTNDRPAAVADSDPTPLREDSVIAATGNVLLNDTDVDADDTLRVALVGTTTANTSVPSGSTPSSNGVVVVGTYGNLSIGADGNYQYVLGVTAQQQAAVNALANQQVVTETFKYNVLDGHGATSLNDATLTFTITGSNEPPINTQPASVFIGQNSPFAFTGTSAISVNDADGNLDRVTLKVDNGTLSSSFTAAGLTISGNGTSGVVLTGSQALINNYLASLQYTPNNGFTGYDYLTIFSDDTLNAFDSDSVEIAVVSVSSPTVNEASSHVVFTVSVPNGQNVDLSLVDGTATGGSTTPSNGSVDYGNNALQYSLDGGQTWNNYTTSFNATLTGSGTSTGLLVRTTIVNDTTPDNNETFQLRVSGGTGTYVTGTATIKDDGNGDIFNNDGTLDNTTLKNNDTPVVNVLTVSNVTVNEGSPYAVFTVTGGNNQQTTLSLAGQGGAGQTTGLNSLQYFDGSNWQTYTANQVVSLIGTSLLVRVALSPEQETALDGPETFQLVATNTGGSPSTGGTGTVNDDGTGGYFSPTNNSATPNTPSGVVLDDDRVLAVSNVTVNEGSPYAVFTVTGGNNQQTTLSLAGQGGAGQTTGLNSLQYFDGSNWQTYTANQVVSLIGTSLLVRVALSPEQETALDGPETFKLVATNTGGSPSTGGTGTVNDDGTGGYFSPTNNSATPNTPSGVVLDDDRVLAVSNVTVNEGSPYAVFTVDGELGQLVSLTLNPGTAIPGTGNDYTASMEISSNGGSSWSSYTSGNVPLNGAGGTLLVRVPILNDSPAVDEPDESFSLVATNTGGSTATGTATIQDNGIGDIFNGDGSLNRSAPRESDGLPTISILPLATVGETDQPANRQVNFSINLSKPATQIVTVEYSTSVVIPTGHSIYGQGLATSGVDFQPIVNAEATFLPGVQSLVLSATVIGDGLIGTRQGTGGEYETESFFITLSNNSANAQIGSGNSEIVIFDNDPNNKSLNFPFSIATTQLDIRGGVADDTIIGGSASDFLSGDPPNGGIGGADRIQGNLGADQITGGPGNDRFLYPSFSHSTFNSYDRIRDFTPGTDANPTAGDRFVLPSLPTNLWNRGVVSGESTLLGALNSAYADRSNGGSLDPLQANEAVLFAYDTRISQKSSITVRNWYLAVNDSTFGRSSTDDLLIDVTNVFSGASLASRASTIPGINRDYFFATS